ncbi:MAG: ABC transporter substrate-binding protein [Clostridia bacterium]|nr:ABC transporter substrate-binding protein [Clostridia bacterium]
MKRFVALLVAALTVFAVFACEPAVPEQTPDAANTPEPTATQAESTPEYTDPLTPTVGGQVTIGDTVMLTGEWLPYWDQWSLADEDLSQLVNTVSTVTQTKGGEYIWDTSVVEKCVPVMVDNEGGWQDKIYVITIHDDLKWSNGDPITAKDFVASLLLFSSPVGRLVGALGDLGKYFVGYDDFTSEEGTPGHTRKFAGVRLLDDYKFSVKINGDPEAGYIPYYYDLHYADIIPINTDYWFPWDHDVVDDGDGAYFSGPFSTNNSFLISYLTQVRYDTYECVTAGAYTIARLNYVSNEMEAILERNPLYKGNYEGQQPYIERVVYKYINFGECFTALLEDEIDVVFGLMSLYDIDVAHRFSETSGRFGVHTYYRNGGERILFQCDFSPTQFLAVRQAIAHLMDRETFLEYFSSGRGAVVHGPYGLDTWMYRESEAELLAALNTYEYSVERAIELLEGDGWIYNADGTPYSGTGVRYKRVTDAEAGSYPHVVEVAGEKYMGLVLEHCTSRSFDSMDYLLQTLIETQQADDVGMQVNVYRTNVYDMMCHIYRDVESGAQYGVPLFCTYNFESNYTAAYDVADTWSFDPELVGTMQNVHYFFNGELERLAADMVYGVEAGDHEGYRRLWLEYVLLMNEYLPELPVYANEYCDVYDSKIQNYDSNTMWSFAQQLIYCWVTE